VAVAAVGTGIAAVPEVHAAGQERTFEYPVSRTQENVGIGGYDLVAYFEDKSATKGQAQYAVKYGDTIYYFSSEENRQMFIQNPAKYLPRFGGFCPVNLRQGQAEKGAPQHFLVHEGRLYICASASAAKTFEEDPQAIIHQAERKVKNFPDYLERGR
jgi:YHS domain-containing protein